MTDQSLGITLVFGSTVVLLGLRTIILKYRGGVTVALLTHFGLMTEKARGLAEKAGSFAWTRGTTRKSGRSASGARSINNSRRSPNHQRPQITHSQYYN